MAGTFHEHRTAKAAAKAIKRKKRGGSDLQAIRILTGLFTSSARCPLLPRWPPCIPGGGWAEQRGR